MTKRKDVAGMVAYPRGVDLDTAEHLREVEAMEERLQEGTAAHEMALTATPLVARRSRRILSSTGLCFSFWWRNSRNTR